MVDKYAYGIMRTRHRFCIFNLYAGYKPKIYEQVYLYIIAKECQVKRLNKWLLGSQRTVCYSANAKNSAL
ncbi:hypothetical protein C8R32_103212 [Nitrosospira sp. Nsp5]|uniref:Uncharacterized protein n=1 Tax=Nitrosospira multiformis TaxID=1231 RepID=A0ABY0T5L4_9PROT|nr:hypothetical protein C8R32_103212 [Nitrosospira sp. Nsp5]SDQ26549.1 hypothetical protein SAMN05216402_0088 [Nitrosospira multiformis]